jgi:hypothetical protein
MVVDPTIRSLAPPQGTINEKRLAEKAGVTCYRLTFALESSVVSVAAEGLRLLIGYPLNSAGVLPVSKM